MHRGKSIIALIVAAVALLCAACSSDHFTIEGAIADGGTQNVRVIYATDDGYECAWVTMQEGRFTYQGVSEELVPVWVCNQQKKVIATVLLKNGDDVKIEGSLAAPYSTKVSGTDANEEWSEFIVAHSDDFSNENYAATDAAIEEYIAANQGNVVSTLLLMGNYSDLTNKKKVDALLAKIEIDARPESVMRGFYAMQAMRADLTDKDRMATMTLWSDRDSMENVRPYGTSLSIYYFWNPDDRMRYNDFHTIKDFGKELNSKRLQIVDVNLDSDTLRWKSILRNDSASWRRYWAVGGVVNNYVRSLNLTSTPYYILADSTGRMLYHGDNFAAARKLIENKLKK
ncbi:MAG: DUF4369 domain-containing protein [Muribaculaceae bacterium]